MTTLALVKNNIREVNGYSLLEVLGSGGTAIAYRASKDSNEYCIREHRFGKATEWKGTELFEREYEVLKALDHPQIPRVYDFFEAQEGRDVSLYMVQELVPGKCLETILSEQGVFKEEQVIDIMSQLSSILEYLHSRETPVVHRDIKPSNIMLDTDGKIRLIDFGIVQDKIQKTVGGSTTFGTVGYSAPEVLWGQATPKSDLYSVGATALTLLSGIATDTLIEGGHIQHQDTIKFKNPSLETLVGSLTQFDPAQRVESAEQLSNYLQQIKDGKQIQRKNNTNQSGKLMQWLASIVPKSLIQTLVHTRQRELQDAQRSSLVVAEPRSPYFAGYEDIPNDAHYTRIDANTYALGIEKLREQGKTPLSFLESLYARMKQPELYNTWLDSDTAIAYKARTTRIKVIHHSELLRNIPKDFNQAFILLNGTTTRYEDLEGIELDTAQFPCNRLLTQEEILGKDYQNGIFDPHPAWLALVSSGSGHVQEDAQFLRDYTFATFDAYAQQFKKADTLMRFWREEDPQQDQLRAACVDNLYGGSNAGSRYNLNGGGRFLLR